MSNLSEHSITEVGLHKLFASIETALSLDKTKLAGLKRLGLERVVDLLIYSPSYYQKRLIYPDLNSLVNGEHVVIKGSVQEVACPARKHQPTKIYIQAETGGVTVVFFKFHNYLKTIFKIGNNVSISGKVEYYDYRPQINHPEIIFDSEFITPNEPIYNLTYGITNSQLRKYIYKAMKFIGDIPEWLPETIVEQYKLPNFMQSIQVLHGSGSNDGVKIEKAALRFKIDEAMANQLGFRYIKELSLSTRGRSFVVSDDLKSLVMRELGFSLTGDQIKVIHEIEKDQESSMQMLRLVQGDVGCGKTIIAILTSLNVMSSGSQVALMVPTEILAQQHYNFAEKILKNTHFKVKLISGKIPGKLKNELLRAIEVGEADLIIGTHSLFQESMKFKDLGYVIVDEQHRFGVEQRMELIAKGGSPDVLIMSATPIPRSLSLTMFGDLPISIIKSMPKSRKPVKTIVAPIGKIEDVCKAVKSAIIKNEKVFWVCPLIETEDDSSNYIDVETRFNYLESIFGDQVRFLHGLMNSEEKSRIINQLKDGAIKIIVSTTVIEVGIDIHDATLIIIENAEKFGLAQLHQLRGRVGRGEKESLCILLYGSIVSKVAFERFKIMKETNDGFLIAEKDLLLRGEGDLLGARQSGEQSFKFLDLSVDGNIINKCNILSKSLPIDKDRLLQIYIYNHKILVSRSEINRADAILH